MLWLRSWLAFLCLAAVVRASDWPQWLGPNRDGASTENVSPWKEAPKVLWRQSVGEGHSSPVVAANRVFLHVKVKDKDIEQINAFDAASGQPLWEKAYSRAAFSSVFGNGPRATPAVIGDKVYTFGVTGVLSCFEAATGNQVWQVDTLKKFNCPNLLFGTSCSPLVDGSRVLMNIGKGASIVAFDKDKGEVLWKALDDPASYSSPILVNQGSQHQVIFFTQQGLVSLKPADGTVFWKFPLVDLLSESSSTPVRTGDLVVASSITSGSQALQLETRDGKPAIEKAWKNDLTCYFATPVPVDNDHLYVVTGTKPPALKVQADLHCVEAKTGKSLWQKPKVGRYHATLLRTGNHKLLMLEDAGNLVLIDPNPKEYKELCRAKVCGKTWAHIALANGRLYVRDDHELICLQLGE